MGREQTRLLHSLIKWAEKECNKWVKDHCYMTKQDAVELFIAKMNEYSLQNKNTSMIFSIAGDVGTSVLDELIMKGEAR